MPAAAAPMHARQAFTAHQPRDALAAEPTALAEPELVVHSRGAVGAAAHLMDRADLTHQLRVSDFAC